MVTVNVYRKITSGVFSGKVFAGWGLLGWVLWQRIATSYSIKFDQFGRIPSFMEGSTLLKSLINENREKVSPSIFGDPKARNCLVILRHRLAWTGNRFSFINARTVTLSAATLGHRNSFKYMRSLWSRWQPRSKLINVTDEHALRRPAVVVKWTGI